MPTLLDSDPSRTRLFRSAFRRDLFAGLDEVRRKCYEFVVENDELGMGPRPTVNARRYAFMDDDRKAEEFRRLVAEQLREHFLEKVEGGTITPRAAAYILKAYEAAVGRSFKESNRDLSVRAPESFPIRQSDFARLVRRDPQTAARFRSLIARADEDAKAIAATLEARALSVAAEALASGASPKQLYARVNREVIALGRQRSELFVHQTMVRAAAEGQLDAFAALGKTEVSIWAEWVRMANACPLCVKASKRGPYKIEKARGLIPLHVRCRCSWRLFAGENPKKKRKKR